MRLIPLAVLSLALTGCVTNPDTGETEPHPIVAPMALLILDVDAALADDEITDDEIEDIAASARLVINAAGLDKRLGIVLDLAVGNAREIRMILAEGDPRDVLRAALRLYLEANNGV